MKYNSLLTRSLDGDSEPDEGYSDGSSIGTNNSMEDYMDLDLDRHPSKSGDALAKRLLHLSNDEITKFFTTYLSGLSADDRHGTYLYLYECVQY